MKRILLAIVAGLILIKRAGTAGVGAAVTVFCTNIWSTIAFSFVWLAGGDMQPWHLFYQPATISALFVFGLVFTFAAIERGDVSIATPIFGVKVVFVAVLLTVLGLQEFLNSILKARVGLQRVQRGFHLREGDIRLVVTGRRGCRAAGRCCGDLSGQRQRCHRSRTDKHPSHYQFCELVHRRSFLAPRGAGE